MTSMRIWHAHLFSLLLISTKIPFLFSLTSQRVSEFRTSPACETRVLEFSSRRRSILFSSEYDDTDFAEDFEDDEKMEALSFLASPLSQLRSDEEEALYRGPFSRKKNWLEKSTDEVLDMENLPLGDLSEDDVESITGLMAAWVRRRSVEAALVVERLLKRVVDDMRAHNAGVHVTARMYTIVSGNFFFCWQLLRYLYCSLGYSYLSLSHFDEETGNRCLGEEWSTRGSSTGSAYP
jgi:hypothetical protein